MYLVLWFRENQSPIRRKTAAIDDSEEVHGWPGNKHRYRTEKRASEGSTRSSKTFEMGIDETSHRSNTIVQSIHTFPIVGEFIFEGLVFVSEFLLNWYSTVTAEKSITCLINITIDRRR